MRNEQTTPERPLDPPHDAEVVVPEGIQVSIGWHFGYWSISLHNVSSQDMDRLCAKLRPEAVRHHDEDPARRMVFGLAEVCIHEREQEEVRTK